MRCICGDNPWRQHSWIFTYIEVFFIQLYCDSAGYSAYYYRNWFFRYLVELQKIGNQARRVIIVKYLLKSLNGNGQNKFLKRNIIP